MEINQLKLVKSFEQHLKASWESYYTTHNIENNSAEFIEFLIQNKIIQAPTIKRFAIQKEFLNVRNKYKNKTSTVRAISDKYSLSIRGIWTILRELEQNTAENSL